MSKEYPNNLTRAQFDLLSALLPPAKSSGRPRTVDLYEVINAILYVLVEGVRWRALPGDFPPWPTVYTYFRNWRKDGTYLATDSWPTATLVSHRAGTTSQPVGSHH